MKTLGAAAVVTGGLTAVILGLAAPAAAGNARDTVDTLSVADYTVIVNKVGSAPLEQ